MKILIAEDEEFSRHILRGQLERLGHEVVAVADGNQAWDRLQSEEFSLVITDWMMPGLDGIGLVRRIRARQDANYVYVILLTAKSEQSDVIEGMEGADDFLTKPHDEAELEVRIRAGQRVIDLERHLHAKNEQLASANAEIELANCRMKNDLDAAAKIQRSLLPTTTPNSDAVDFAWIYDPCHELAGDIFNVFQLDEEHIVFYLLDVVGKGVPAALLSVTLSRFLSPQACSSLLETADSSGDRSLSPGQLATELNERFPMDANNEQNFTLLYGCYHTRTRELRYVSAGHPGPLYIPADGEPEILQCEGFPIGIHPEPEYVDHALVLSPGDRLVLYSDGLLDAENPQGDYFEKEGLLACVSQQHRQSFHAEIRSLHDEVRRFCDGHPQTDDISVLAMHLRPEV